MYIILDLRFKNKYLICKERNKNKVNDYWNFHKVESIAVKYRHITKWTGHDHDSSNCLDFWKLVPTKISGLGPFHISCNQYVIMTRVLSINSTGWMWTRTVVVYCTYKTKNILTDNNLFEILSIFYFWISRCVHWYSEQWNTDTKCCCNL